MIITGIAGSPRRGGNTDTLLKEVLRGAASKGAQTRTFILSNLEIWPCEHCDACLKKGECKITDDMQMIYTALTLSDWIILASPLHFMTVTSQMKTMIDRCQALWARKYILKKPPLGSNRERKGLFISVGGRKVPQLFDAALVTVKSFFKVLDITYDGAILFPDIDEQGAIDKHPEALTEAFQYGQKMIVEPGCQTGNINKS